MFELIERHDDYNHERQVNVEKISLDLIIAMSQRIVDNFKPQKVIVFGSWARGDANNNSDVDLLVVIDCDKAEYINQMAAIRKVLRDFKVPKDIIVANQETLKKYGEVPGYIYQSALQEGRVLYEQSLV